MFILLHIFLLIYFLIIIIIIIIIIYIFLACWDYLDAPPARVTGADIPMPYAENLEKNAIPQMDNVVNVVERVLYRKK